jgi:type IX secretion system PorP/SprF family membrane protein
MNRVRTTWLILIFCISAVVSGQTSDPTQISLGYPVYSQYLQNGLMINPAYTGSRGALSALMSYRIQWLGKSGSPFSGSPLIQSVSLHTPMKNDRVALGVLAQFMQFGYTKSSSVYASYAYHLRLGEGKLSLGLKGGFDRSNTDFTGIKLSTLPGVDPVFSANEKPYMLPNIGAGIYYFRSKIFAGISVPSFLTYNRTGTGSVQASHSFNNYRFQVTAGGLVPISSFIKFKPSVLVEYSLQNKLNQLDLNGNFILADLIWVGGSWRTTEEVAVAILQVQVNPQLMFGFSYDYPAGRMKQYSNGSTEFILRYEFGYRVSASNPRYF